MNDKVEFILDPATGGVTFLHSDAAMRLAARLAGTATIRRASHVEPAADSRGWTADLAPVGGPVLGPFPTKQEALDREAAWLTEHVLYPSQGTDHPAPG